jgi:hypothetical protein
VIFKVNRISLRIILIDCLIESKNKSGVTTTPLLEFLKRKREDRKQEKLIRRQQVRNNKQAGRNTGSNMNEDEYYSSQRYKGGDKSK